MTVLAILEELASNNSTKFKVRVLEREAGNEDLKEFFRLCLDPSINFYIKKVPQYSKSHTGEKTLADAMEHLSKLSRREVTGSRAKFLVSTLMTECSEDDAEVLKRLIKRDPNCKVSVATVNKAWPGLVELWPCMLCEKSTRKNLDGIQYPAIIQEKSDGLRDNILHIGGKVLYRTRAGKFIQMHGALDDQVREFAKHLPYNDFVIDGEGLVIKPQHIGTPSKFWTSYSDGDLYESRRTGNGIFNKGIRDTIRPREAAMVRLKVWDVIPAAEFFAGTVGGIGRFAPELKGYDLGPVGEPLPYKNRITILKNVLKANTDTVTHIGLSLTRVVKSEREALAFYKMMLEQGKEGAILKNLESVWEDRRSKNQVKLKVEKEIDLRCVGTYPHKKRKNWIGGLNLESECGRVKVNTGSGLKERHRKLTPDKFLGHVIMIKSNGLIESERRDEGEWSLYLPIFKEIRIDKDKADSYDDIVAIFDSI